jgi:hypothetical protein
VATGWVRAALGLGEMLALNISSLFRPCLHGKIFFGQKMDEDSYPKTSLHTVVN